VTPRFSHFAAELIFGTEHLHAVAELGTRRINESEAALGTSQTSDFENGNNRRSFNKGGIYTIGGPGDSNKRPHRLTYDVEREERTRFETLRPEPPRRIVFPFCASWEGKELRELMMGHMFGEEVGESRLEAPLDGGESRGLIRLSAGVEVIRRDDWTRINRDHRWRKFERGECL
jgi:hypothetical protein